MSVIHDLSATEQAELIRKKEISPLELMRHYLERIDRFDRRLGAFITLLPDQALAAAERATVRVQKADPDELPPLFGVPTAIKDLAFTAGVRTTLGSAALHDFVPEADGHTVGLIKAAGLISVGKTNVPEFGVACYTANDLVPDARTPWDESRSAAGSSGGAAAAVAAGLLPVAHGSDAGGSIRTPAASCGLIGFKPSRGATSTAPSLSWTAFFSEGPLARTMADVAGFLEIITAPYPGDPLNRPLRPGSYLAALERPPGRLRIARAARPGGDGPVNPECLAVWERASKLLAELGHEVVDIDPPDGDVFDQMVDGFINGFASSLALLADTLLPPGRRNLLRPLSQWLVAMGERASGIDVQRALSFHMVAAQRTLLALDPYDALLTPTTADLPTPLDWLKADDDPTESYRRIAAWSAFTPAYNVSGQPAVSLPLGQSSDGLPIGVQLVGRRFEDDRLLALAAQLEQAAPWSDRHPAIWTER
ncbi:amidase [Micromonospora sp. NPDC050495]|uniref:amidase n=1 Tax=Micromonospora sp. NPDC050495 TaxID=3154936 RepID=UPI0033E4AB73